MTQTTSIGSLSTLGKVLEGRPTDDRYTHRAKAGIPAPGVEVRVRDRDGNEIPRDDETTGESEVHGPWIVDDYNRPGATLESFTDDGWFETGDIATRDGWGYVDIVDRAKDVVKSGGEWISSVELENEPMAHDDVSEAAVIAVPHEKWGERSMACVVPTRGAEDLTGDELVEFLAEEFPGWWLPDRVEFGGETPKTSTDEPDEKVLRERFEDVDVETDREAPEPSEA
jgi:fatty-acyl-CoA synthase